MRNQIILTLIIISILAFFGCQTDNMTAPSIPAVEEDGTKSLAKRGSETNYPMFNTKVFEYKSSYDWYEEGNLHLDNGTRNKLSVEEGSLIPPSYIPWGENVEISMEVDYDEDNNELLFTFGPHGCQFSTPAMVVLDYRRLGKKLGKLYYVDEDGNYIPQDPEKIDLNRRNMVLYFDHFSRYAIGME